MWKVLPTALMLILTTTAATRAQRPSDTTVLESGRALFTTYCASCHGVSGRGHGPVAGELRHRPADLTQFAAQNGGVFNGARIHRFIDGRTVITAHGTMEMPVWGEEFKWREGLPENGINARVDALVQYLETLQERAGH